ncbi:MAG: TAXI family TRAP transporter solute-binding subunit [Pseudomonadota bacterium]
MLKNLVSVGVGLSMLAAASAASAEPGHLSLATATKGGGFELFGSALADVVNAQSDAVQITAENTKGSLENIGLLASGAYDLGMVQGVAAHEAFEGIGQEAVDLKVIAAIYSSPGLFVVAPGSNVRTVEDLVSEPIAWGTRTSGLTLMAGYAMDGLGLDRDGDFQARYLDRAGDGPPLVLNGDVAAFWGAGIGWPGFVRVTEAGGRFVEFTEEQVDAITAKHPFLKPMAIPAGSYPGQDEAKRAVGVWSFILSRPDLPDETAYAVAKAIHEAQPALAERLPQAQETTPESTRTAAPADRLHAGVSRYLEESGF